MKQFVLTSDNQCDFECRETFYLLNWNNLSNLKPCIHPSKTLTLKTVKTFTQNSNYILGIQ